MKDTAFLLNQSFIPP